MQTGTNGKQKIEMDAMDKGHVSQVRLCTNALSTNTSYYQYYLLQTMCWYYYAEVNEVYYKLKGLRGVTTT